MIYRVMFAAVLLVAYSGVCLCIGAGVARTFRPRRRAHKALDCWLHSSECRCHGKEKRS